MRPIVPILLVACILETSCKGSRENTIELSRVLHEKAQVVALIHTPSFHNFDVQRPTTNTEFFGMDRVDTNELHEDDIMRLNKVAIPEKFAVVFRYQRGTFMISSENIYRELRGREGATVDIRYQKIYRIAHELPMRRVLIGYNLRGVVLVGLPSGIPWAKSKPSR